MDEQARATLVLSAATITAGLVQNHPHHNAESAVKLMMEVLQEMEKQGVVGPGTDSPVPRTMNFRLANRRE